MAADRRVCVLLAGPGWGKSTMLAAWLATTEFVRPRLEPISSDRLREILGELGKSLRESPAIPGELLGLAPSQIAPDGPVDSVVLVLDDIQDVLDQARLWGQVEDLCRYGPRWLHLVLVSRRKPPFSMQRLRGQGLVADIDAPDLAFGTDEVDALLAALTGVADRELAAAVQVATGGWPAAVRMVVDALAGMASAGVASAGVASAGVVPGGVVPGGVVPGGVVPGGVAPGGVASGGVASAGMAPGGMAPAGRDEVLRQVVGPGGRLGEYLAEEVFAAEPPAVPELLHRIAVVCQVTPALCDALGVGEAAGLLPDLARRGLVQFSPGPEPRWSLSPLVREFFLGRPGLSREERVVLNRRAAAFHAGRGAYGEALRHYAAAEDHPAVASLLAERGTELVDTGQVDAVLAAAELAARSDDRRVQQALGYARHVRGQWAMALDAFDRAGADQEELTPALAWRMGLIRYDRGEPAAALALYSRGRLDREDTVEEALLLCWTAAAYHLTGQYDLCRASVERAAVVAERCRDARTWASVDTVRMLLAAAVGDRAGADAWFRSALQWAEAAGDMLQGLRITVNRAGHLLDVGLLPEALREVERALRRNRTCGYLMLDARALTVRGLAAALRGELDAALHDFAAAGQIYQAIGSRFLGRSLVGVGYVHRVRADLAQARAAYEEALAQAEPAHDVQCLGAALSGLARVRAVDDPAVARTLADRAVELAVPATLVQALIAQGWVALLSGDAGAAAGNAGQAAGSARAQRDRPGLAEALELAAMATHGRQVALSQLEEAIRIWAEVGCPIEEAKTRLVAARLSGDRSAAELAEQALRSHGLRTDRPHAAGPLAVLADSAPTISIRALGAFRVVRGGEPVPAGAWRSKKARSLLKILVARRGRPVSREQLTGLLWPEEGSGMASRRLSVLLSTVRAVLGGSHQSLDEGPIVTDGDVVWLDLGRVHVDVEHFLALAGAALEAHGRGLAQATTQLIAAESHYGGDVLEDDPYQEWAGPLRDEARTMYACVLRALVQRLQELDDIDRSMRYSLLLLQCDRYEESAHLDLVRILAKNGRRGEARLRYREYVRRMTEIGVRPRPFPEAGPLQADSSDAS